MKLLLAVCVALVLSTPELARAVERPDLEARLPTVHPVYCADSSSAWEADPGALGGLAAAYTWVAGPNVGDIHLSPTVCARLADTDSRRFPDAAEALYHEWVHAEFLSRDEGATECFALHFYRYALRTWWGFTRRAAERAYRSAWASHELLGLLYPQYRGDCTIADAAP